MLFPSSPDLRAKTHRGLLAIAHNGRFHQSRIIKDLVLFCDLIVHILHQGNVRITAILIDQIVDASHSTQDAVIFLSGQSETEQVHGLKFYPPLFEIPLCLLSIEAFAFTKYLNVQ